MERRATVELLAQGARFFELLGYSLAVLALGILFTGVIWSLRLHAPEKRRTFFLIGSLAALTALCGGGLLLLIWTQPLSPGTLGMPRPPQAERGPAGKVNNDGVDAIEIYVRPNGTILFVGRELDIDGLVPHLRQEDRNRQFHVTILADAAASIGVVQPVMRHLTQHGVAFTVQVSHQRDCR